MWSQEMMTLALAEVREELISIRAASKKYGIPRGTIQDRIHKRVQDECAPGRKPLIEASDEKKLLDYASNRASMGVGFSKSNFMRYLYIITYHCLCNGIKNTQCSVISDNKYK